MVNRAAWHKSYLCTIDGAGRDYLDYYTVKKYGFYGIKGESRNLDKKALFVINDRGTWKDVYYACINNPKDYFYKKV